MNIPDCHTIVFSVDCYDGNHAAMWEDIRNTMQILLKLDYMTRVRADCGNLDIIVVDYCYADAELTDGLFAWVSFDEMDTVLHMREEQEDGKI